MELKPLLPSQALDLAYRRQKVSHVKLNAFETARQKLLSELDPQADEADLKEPIRRFFEAIGFPNYLNSRKKRDWVMHTGPSVSDPVGIIFELKHEKNKPQMVQKGNLNRRALHELLLYYFQDRTSEQQALELRQLIITTGYEWFIFDAHEFHKVFWKNTELKSAFHKFKQGQTTAPDTAFFYDSIAKPLLDKLTDEIEFTYVNLDERDEKGNRRKLGERGLLWLSKLFSPPHLLKEPFAQDANTLNRAFYEELLYLMGLEEVKVKGRKLIQRCVKANRHRGSLLENTLIQLHAEDVLRNIPPDDRSIYGDSPAQQAEGVALSLCLTWINRLLFLKLLEGQLRRYHAPNDEIFKFLDPSQIKEYDQLNRLFYRILNRPQNERDFPENTLYSHVPYLNSSLFEPSLLERFTLRISNLDDQITLPLMAHGRGRRSVLRAKSGDPDPVALTYLLRFLDAYDFASEGEETVQEDDRPLISAAVLGLIFEKINGYREGSFYTPGSITMYMCRHTLRQAVVKHFNERYGFDVANIKELAEVFDHKKRLEYSAVFNELRICDPAVGSGHFLVSALNELLAIKSELRLLLADDGTLLRYSLLVARDEIGVTSDEDDTIFQYRATWDSTTGIRRVGRDHTRLQSALFREKRHIIEHCLFGVDINPNSVLICRLRLWIELLKHAYYTPESEYQELETLPNLDLNIRAGNSLISRFNLDDDLTEVFAEEEFTIENYRAHVSEFFGARGRDAKHDLRKFLDQLRERFTINLHKRDTLRKQLNDLRGQRTVLEHHPVLIAELPRQRERREKKITALKTKEAELKHQIQEHEKAVLYRDAFEWRFEFPEVLDDTGAFRGFDVVIGNPPYGHVSSKEQQSYFSKAYHYQDSQKDLYLLFLERGKALVRPEGLLSWIIPNTWLQTIGAKKFRSFMVKDFIWNKLLLLPEKTFDEAVVDTHVLFTQRINLLDFEEKGTNNQIEIQIRKGGTEQLLHYIPQNSLPTDGSPYNLSTNSDYAKLAKRVIKENQRLDAVCKIYNGVKPYEIGKGTPPQTKEILDEKPFIKEGVSKPGDDWTPLLRGSLIDRYTNRWSNDSWIKYGPWLAAPRDPSLFNTPKVIFVRQTSDKLIAVLTTGGFIARNNLHIVLPNSKHTNLEYILGCINSRILDVVYTFINPEKGETLAEVKKEHLSQMPIPNATSAQQLLVANLVSKILDIKATDASINTLELEHELDIMMYHLYGLDYDEALLIEPHLSLNKDQYDAMYPGTAHDGE